MFRPIAAKSIIINVVSGARNSDFVGFGVSDISIVEVKEIRIQGTSDNSHISLCINGYGKFCLVSLLVSYNAILWHYLWESMMLEI